MKLTQFYLLSAKSFDFKVTSILTWYWINFSAWNWQEISFKTVKNFYLKLTRVLAWNWLECSDWNHREISVCSLLEFWTITDFQDVSFHDSLENIFQNLFVHTCCFRKLWENSMRIFWKISGKSKSGSLEKYLEYSFDESISMKVSYCVEVLEYHHQ